MSLLKRILRRMKLFLERKQGKECRVEFEHTHLTPSPSGKHRLTISKAKASSASFLIEKDDHWRTLVNQLDYSRFRARSLSWIYTDGTHFFKIRKYNESIGDDLHDARAKAHAKTEHDNLALLHQLDDAVVKPLALVDACVIYPCVEGYDLVDESSRKRIRDNRRDFRRHIEDGITLLARLHRHQEDLPEGLARCDYRNSEFLPLADEGLISTVENRPASLVIQGFEIRNLRYDTAENRLRFLDPHHIFLGAPEEDVARYVLSLLMINWGRHLNFMVWEDFDPADLIRAYENARGMALDRRILAYMFDLKVAMRKKHARRNIQSMNPLQGFTAHAYLKLFFRNVDAWRKGVGFL